MSESRWMLIACTSSQPLRDLLRRTAGNLALDLREVASPDEVCDLRGLAPWSIAVVDGGSPSDRLLASISGLSSSRIWPILVTTDELSEGEALRAMSAGAVNCMSLGTAMQAIPYLMRNILWSRASDVDPAPERLPIWGKTVLMIPGHILTDGELESLLPPIPGRLLECMALHANSTVSFAALKRFAWDSSSGATDHALCQQMSRLRGALRAFGIENRVRCLRGRGYMLERRENHETTKPH